MKILITSGGTKVPIDTIRHIGNHSGGRTGAELAKAAWERGHQAIFLHAQYSQMPWQADLKLSPETTPAEYSQLVSKLDHWRGHKIQCHGFNTLNDYQRNVHNLIATAKPDVVILAAAVSDYTCEPTDGKISSTTAPQLQLTPAPKVLAEIRKQNPRIPIVGFKNLVNESEEVLIEAAYEQILKYKLTACIANLTPEPNKVSTWKTYLVTPEKTVISLTRSELAGILLTYLQERLASQLFSSTHWKQALAWSQDVQDMTALCRKWSQYNLFERYQPQASAEFGFVAKRHKDGFLITTRGSSKSLCTTEHIAYVTSKDGLHFECQSEQAKQSRNANLAWHIFQTRPEIQYVLHTHIELFGAKGTSHNRIPGTHTDWQEIQPLILAGQTVICQDMHGTLVLVESPGELEAALLQHNLFSANPASGFYELAYSRFKNDKLAQLIHDLIPNSAKVLDLAAGTGYLTSQLYNRGFTNITAADPNTNMLLKITAPVPTEVCGFTDCSKLKTKFDLISIRQAINYLHPTDAQLFCQETQAILNPGGFLVFDTFYYDGKVNPVHETHGENEEYRLVTQEANRLEGTIIAKDLTGDIIYHSQVTRAWPKTQNSEFHKIYDFNKFFGFKPENLEAALAKNGYRLINKIAEGKSLRYVWQYSK